MEEVEVWGKPIEVSKKYFTLIRSQDYSNQTSVEFYFQTDDWEKVYKAILDYRQSFHGLIVFMVENNEFYAMKSSYDHTFYKVDFTPSTCRRTYDMCGMSASVDAIEGEKIIIKK